MVGRLYNGHSLRPGETKELEMLTGDVEAFRELARPNRGVYMSGHLAGLPLPRHPLRFIDLPDPMMADIMLGDGNPVLLLEAPRCNRGQRPVQCGFRFETKASTP